MRKRNDILYSDKVESDRKKVGESILDVKDSVILKASATMSLAAGTNNIYMSDAGTMSITSGTISISGQVRLQSLNLGTTEDRILYISSSDNSLKYKVGIPLSAVLSASNSTGNNDIYFVDGRKSYSVYNGITSSYTFAAGASTIKSIGGSDYSQIYTSTQSSYISTMKLSDISGSSKIRTYCQSGYTYADIQVNDLTVPGSISYFTAKTGVPEGGSASVVIGSRADAGISPSISDLKSQITLGDNGYMLTDLGYNDKNGYAPNTKYSSSSVLEKSTSGTSVIATISIPKRTDSNWFENGFYSAVTNGPTYSVPVSIKAWVVAASKYSVKYIYKADIDALFISGTSSYDEISSLSLVSYDKSESGNATGLGCDITTDGENLIIGVSQSSNTLLSNSVIWKVYYEYLLCDYYGPTVTEVSYYTKSLYE